MYRWTVCLVGLLLAGPGCVSMSTFNSPQTTPKDEVHLGVGVGGMFVGEAMSGPLPEIYGRVGVGDRVDVGGKVTGPFGGVTAGLKYQPVDRGIDVAADLSGSLSFTGSNAVHPALFLGTERLYVGGRMVVFGGNASGEVIGLGLGDVRPSTTMPGLLIGGSLGERAFRVMPEVGVYFQDGTDKALIVPGIGLQFRLGEGE